MEELMQYVWLHRLWLAGELRTVDDEPVAVIDVGQLNRDAGPDFFNSKIKIGDKFWCGNVEIHVKASDWYRHGHQDNRAYDSVVLHVVETNDCRIRRPDGQVIPQIILPTARDFAERYGHFINNSANQLACAPEIQSLPPVLIHSWLDSLAFERLHAKADAVKERLERCGGDWEQAAFITLARAMGAGINGDSFERVAASLPLRLLHKHCDSLVSLEAFLFGQAGLLDCPQHDGYVEQLQAEYSFLRNKFSLRPLENAGWRMSRIRPQSFPHRRLAALAMMAYGGFSILRRVLEVKDEAEARKLFDVTLTGYWIDHFNFTAPMGAMKPTALSRQTVDMLVINVVAPLLMAYGETTGDDSLSDRAVDILEHIPGESNRFVRHFIGAGIPCSNALVSQAMVQLHTRYCDVRKCLYCRIGHRLLAAKARP